MTMPQTELFLTCTTLAYVGPGPGLSMVGVLFGLLATLLAAIAALAFWPIRAFIRWLRVGRVHRAPISHE
jgi:hypothetical protein